ncbi:hypothetical protein AB0L06_00450 [Spirillospora sp. NPDC052269]
MLAGAGMQVLGFVITVVHVRALRAGFRTRLAEDGSAPGNSTLDGLIAGGIVLAGVFTLFGVGLWIWMAFMNRAGRNWARTTGTVFFGIYTLSAPSDLTMLTSDSGRTSEYSVGSSSPADFAVSIVTWAVGLAVILLLWNKASDPYFRPAYGPPPMPYGQGPFGYRSHAEQPGPAVRPHGGSAPGDQPPAFEGRPPYPLQAPPPSQPAPPPVGQDGEAPPPAPPNWQSPN